MGQAGCVGEPLTAKAQALTRGGKAPVSHSAVALRLQGEGGAHAGPATCPRSLLGCTPQAYEACARPASRRKSPEPVRDINGLMDGGAYTSEARTWSDSLLCAANSGQNTGHGDSLRSLRGQGEVSSHWRQVSSSVTRETCRGAHISLPL